MRNIDDHIHRMMNELVLAAPPARPIRSHRSSPNPRRAWGRIVIPLAGVGVVVAALLVRTTGPSSEPTHPRPDPAWVGTVRALLPDEYAIVSLQDRNDMNTWVLALNPTSATMLEIRVSRVPIPADPTGENLPHFFDETGDWFEFDEGFNVVSTDGRQTQVACHVLDESAGACSDQPGYPLRPGELRSIAREFSAHLTPELTSAWPVPEGVTLMTDEIGAIVQRYMPELSATYSISQPTSATIAFSATGDQTEVLRVSVTAGFYTSSATTRSGGDSNLRWRFVSGNLIVIVSAPEIPAAELDDVEQAVARGAFDEPSAPASSISNSTSDGGSTAAA